MNKAVETLRESRKNQMLMCIFAYAVSSHTQKEIFEMNQGYMHSATEQLSGYLEQIKTITKDTAADILKDINQKVK